MQSIPDSSQADPLTQLKDIHVPSTISAWPLDWGWWCLAAIILGLIIVLIVIAVRKYRFNQARREAKALLNSVSSTQNNWPMEINQILKRTALSYFPNQEVASLYGSQWQSFLLQVVPKKRRTKIQDGLTQLQQLQYTPDIDNSYFETCVNAAHNWLNYLEPKQMPSDSNKNIEQGATHA